MSLLQKFIMNVLRWGYPGIKGTEQTHLDEADLLALVQHMVHGFQAGFRTGAHHDDQALGLRVAVVFERHLVAGEVHGADGPGGEAIKRGQGDLFLED